MGKWIGMAETTRADTIDLFHERNGDAPTTFTDKNANNRDKQCKRWSSVNWWLFFRCHTTRTTSNGSTGRSGQMGLTECRYGSNTCIHRLLQIYGVRGGGAATMARTVTPIDYKWMNGDVAWCVVWMRKMHKARSAIIIDRHWLLFNKQNRKRRRNKENNAHSINLTNWSFRFTNYCAFRTFKILHSFWVNIALTV